MQPHRLVSAQEKYAFGGGGEIAVTLLHGLILQFPWVYHCSSFYTESMKIVRGRGGISNEYFTILFEKDSVLTAYIKLVVSMYFHRQFCFDYILLHSLLCTAHYYTCCILHVITFVHAPNQFWTHYFTYLNCPQKCLANETSFKATILISTAVSQFKIIVTLLVLKESRVGSCVM